MGYERYEGQEALEAMTEFYSVARLYINFFQPSMKLIRKTRIGSKVTKKYDTARTPLDRLLDSKSISELERSKLRDEFRSFDPVSLLAEMYLFQKKLWQLSSQKTEQGNTTLTAADTTISIAAEGDKRNSKQNTLARTDGCSVESYQHPIPARAGRKQKDYNGKMTKTAQLLEQIASLSVGSPVQASDFFTDGMKNSPFVYLVLKKACKRGLLTRLSHTKFIRSRPVRGEFSTEGPGLRITEDFVVNAVQPESGQIIYRDTSLVGFGLRVTPRSKSFIVEARVNGKNRRITIGTTDALSVRKSRHEAISMLREMHSGILPMSLRIGLRKRVHSSEEAT